MNRRRHVEPLRLEPDGTPLSYADAEALFAHLSKAAQRKSVIRGHGTAGHSRRLQIALAASVCVATIALVGVITTHGTNSRQYSSASGDIHLANGDIAGATRVSIARASDVLGGRLPLPDDRLRIYGDDRPRTIGWTEIRTAARPRRWKSTIPPVWLSFCRLPATHTPSRRSLASQVGSAWSARSRAWRVGRRSCFPQTAPILVASRSSDEA